MTKTNGPAPAPAVPSWALRHLSETERRVQDLSTELEAVEVAMRGFRAEHMAVLGTSLVYKCREITERARLDAEWWELVHKRDNLLAQWQVALKYYSEAKSAV